MKSQLTRRNFLKVTASSLVAFTGIGFLAGLQPDILGEGQKLPNVIIILFDTLAARHLSLYGYSRKTAPNLAKFSKNAIVYRSHHAAGNYTMPSTASLLTGTYPWTHRSFFGFFGIPREDIVTNNIFRLIGDAYYRVGYGQNLLADLILYQFDEFLDLHIDSDVSSLVRSPAYRFVNRAFSNDRLYASLSTQGFYFYNRNKAGSLFLSILDKLSVEARYKLFHSSYEQFYPKGVPHIWLNNVYFSQEPVFNNLMGVLDGLPQPSLVYLHFWSPHEPYRPHEKFIGMFKDDWKPPDKGYHFFGDKNHTYELLNEYRLQYDEYIAHIDAEFGRLIRHMEEVGLLDNSYVIVTSDHGQLFERGVHGHFTELLYEPLIQIPLIISKPKQQGRLDIFTPTSNVDVFPSLLHISGQPVPEWCEGRFLPGLGGEEDPDRSIFVVEAKNNHVNMPLTKASVAIIRGQYKLIHYMGYPGYENVFEFYDLENDPEELDDMYASKSSIAQDMQAELEVKLEEVNRPYLDTNLTQ